MKLSPHALLAIVVALGVAGAGVGTWLLVERVGTGSPGPIPACGPAPPVRDYSFTPVPAGQYVNTVLIENSGSGPQNGVRISVWSESNSTYYLYIMDSSQYEQLGWTSNASGNASHRTLQGPAHSYTWGSGPVKWANATVVVGDGDWYVVLFDPARRRKLSTWSAEVATPPNRPDHRSSAEPQRVAR